MKADNIEINYPFLQGGGEMGSLTRSFDWTTTSLGSPEKWPQSLRTTISILLNSKFPMFLFWGPDLVCFYNDAYRPSLGNNGKHPSALGQKGEKVWPEIWAEIKPLIDQVLAGGEATWSEDQLLPIFRNGKHEDVYWTFSYSPVKDETGQPTGVFVACTETTQTVQTLRELNESTHRFQNLVQQATVGIIVLSGPDMKVDLVNNAYGRLVGRSPEELKGKLLFDVIPEGRDEFLPLLRGVLTSGEPLFLDSAYYTVFANGKKIEGYLDIKYQPYRESNNCITGVMAICYDVTKQVQDRKKAEESEHQVRSLVESAPFPIGVYVGREMRIQLANKSIMEVWGKGTDVVGKLYSEVLPELENQAIYEKLDEVFITGIPYQAQNQLVHLTYDGKIRDYYFNYNFTPLFDGKGAVYGVMNTAADVSDLNLATLKIEESELNLRNIILQAPVAMCILREPDHIVEIANDRMYELWGKPKEVILNRPLFDGLPEARNQGFEELLKDVYNTGKTFTAYGVPALLPRKDKMETIYLNFVYEAFKGGNGSISGIMAVATDVTEQVIANKKIESSEARFRLMADAMPQFVWTGDAEGNLDYFNQSVYQFSGLSKERLEREGWLQIVHPDDQEENIRVWTEAISSGSDFIFNHRFKNKDGGYRWQLSRAVPQRDASGKIQSWIGTSTDIHDHKLFEEELNRMVADRTLALENNNKELERSNSNLQEFAYAASHDLKEPIRKIHFFADRLKQEHAGVLNKDGIKTLERLEVATDRMRTLVDDLLDYSQVSRGVNRFEQVNLGEKINLVVGDLEMAVQEKEARITIGDMPDVRGHRRQLQQLFQNLIGNALKYSHPHTIPQINISSQLITGSEAGIPLNEEALKEKFYLIKISDNGIGFDQKDAERIFQVFTRLHGNAEYKGTGVGLSIARKVVENHKGFIYAQSNLGHGSTFFIGLPVE